MLSIEDKQLPVRLSVDVKMLEESACFNGTFPLMEHPLADALCRPSNLRFKVGEAGIFMTKFSAPVNTTEDSEPTCSRPLVMD